MKTLKFIIALILLPALTYAQNPRLAVIGIDANCPGLNSTSLTELVRIQLTKYQKYEIIDRYEIDDVLTKNNIDASGCYSISCLIEAGKVLKVNKVLSGSVDQIGESMFYRIRLIDVEKGIVEKEISKEFLMLQDKINPMTTILLNELNGIGNDKVLEKSLTSKNTYESSVNNPHYNSLSLSGPRMGYTFLTGTNAEIFKKPESQGGYDGYPALFQFGYQFEKQYLTEGKLQALVEFIPMVSGLDQGLFIPSFTIMNGLRSNVNGLEFAIGPTLSFVREAEFMQIEGSEPVYMDYSVDVPLEANTFYQMDSRGSIRAKTSIVIAVGYSIRSGRMNIPLNAFIVPGKESMRFGVSFGFNARG